MKYLLSGVAMAALIAAGVPAMAQQTTGASPSHETMPQGTMSKGATSTTPSKSARAVKKARKTHKTAEAGMRKHSRKSSKNDIADQLNREELQRVTSGSGGSMPSGETPSSAMPSSTTPSGKMPANGMPSGSGKQ